MFFGKQELYQKTKKRREDTYQLNMIDSIFPLPL